MLEHFDDRSNVGTVFRKLSSTSELRESFPAGSTSVFRLQLPPYKEILVEFPGGNAQPKWFKRDKLAVYWVDSNPLAPLERPLAYFVFKGTRLETWELLNLPILVSGRRMPTLRYDPDYEIPFGNYESFFRDTQTSEDALLPLTCTSVAADDTPCTPIQFVTCLLFQGKVEAPQEGGDAVEREAKSLVQAFAGRKYTVSGTEEGGIIRAKDADNPVPQMLADLMSVIPKNMCECSADQLVLILVGHHGADADDGIHTENTHPRVSFCIEPLNGNKISWMPYAEFGQLLAAALATKGLSAKNLFLVIFGCYSGDAFEIDRYGKHLPGAFIVTSAPDRQTSSYMQKFSYLVSHCLKNPEVQSWPEFVNCLKKTAGQTELDDPEDKSLPKRKIPMPVPAGGRAPS